MADKSHNTPFRDSATGAIVPNACRVCAGDGFVLFPSLDACPRCAAIAEADWLFSRNRAAAASTHKKGRAPQHAPAGEAQ
jgi:hypothetical protein